VTVPAGRADATSAAFEDPGCIDSLPLVTIAPSNKLDTAPHAPHVTRGALPITVNPEPRPDTFLGLPIMMTQCHGALGALHQAHWEHLVVDLRSTFGKHGAVAVTSTVAIASTNVDVGILVGALGGYLSFGGALVVLGVMRVTGWARQ
jgi:hypothetical protein